MTAIQRPDQPGITQSELATLLGLVASYDQRTIGRADVEAWHLIAIPGRWTLPYASRAVVEFQAARPDDRIRPGHITQIIRARRERYAATYRHENYPPEVHGDEAREMAWDDQRRVEHVRRCMDRWAAGEEGSA